MTDSTPLQPTVVLAKPAVPWQQQQARAAAAGCAGVEDLPSDGLPHPGDPAQHAHVCTNYTVLHHGTAPSSTALGQARPTPAQQTVHQEPS
jgi:hypothetical protein